MGVYIAYYGVVTLLFGLLANYKFVICAHRIPIFIETSKWYKRQMSFFMIVASLLLIFIIGLRSDHQGIDLYNSLGTGYFFYYHSINADSLVEILRNFSSQKYANYELGFVLFSKMLGTLCGNQQILLFACAVLSIALAGILINKCSRNTWLSMVLFISLPCFTTVMFSAIRQGIAIGIIMFSFIFVKEKKVVCFILTVILACTFHSSAIVALAAYPAYNVRINKKNTFIVGMGSLVVIHFFKEPLFWMLAKIVHDSPKLYRNNSINFFLILSLVYMVCVLFCKKSDYETRGFTNIFWLACAAQSFSSLHNLASRITWYFLTVLVILIPNLVVNMNIKEKRIKKPLMWIIGGISIFLGLYYLRNNSMAMANPYIPFWDK